MELVDGVEWSGGEWMMMMSEVRYGVVMWSG